MSGESFKEKDVTASNNSGGGPAAAAAAAASPAAATAAASAASTPAGKSSTYFKKLRVLLDKLGENDEQFATIDFCKQKNLFAYCWDDDDLFSELLGILRTNTVVNKIDLDPSLLRRLPDDQVEVFYEAIGSVEHLQELNFTSLTGSSSVLDIDLLSICLLKCSKQLQSLRLHSIRPSANEHDDDEDDEDGNGGRGGGGASAQEDDLTKFQTVVLPACTALEKIEMYITATATNMDLDLFVRSFALVPNLYEIRLISSLRKRSAWMSGTTIEQYVQSKSLKKLTLRNQRLLSDHIQCLVDAMLALPPLLQDEDHSASAQDQDGQEEKKEQPARKQDPDQEQKHDDRDHDHDDDDDDDDHGPKKRGLEFLDVDANNLGDYGAMALARLLQNDDHVVNADADADASDHNGQQLPYQQTLTELDISENWIGDEGIIAIAEALQYNTTLQYLNVQKNCFSTKGYMALIEMMQKNYYIEELDIDTIETPEYVLDTIEFYLHLNSELGRANFLQFTSDMDKQHPPKKNTQQQQKQKQQEDQQQPQEEEEEEEEEEMEEEEEEEEMEDEDEDEQDRKRFQTRPPQTQYYGKVRPEHSREDWVDAIDANLDELSFVFYLIRSNPSLCQL